MLSSALTCTKNNRALRPLAQKGCAQAYIRALRRRHCVGGGAPVNFGRRRRDATLATPKNFFNAIVKNLFLVIDRKLAPKKCTAKWHRRLADKLSAAAARPSKKIGGATRLGRRRALACIHWPISEELLSQNDTILIAATARQ